MTMSIIFILPLRVLSCLIRILVSDPLVHLQSFFYSIQAGKNSIVFTNGYFSAILKAEFYLQCNNIDYVMLYIHHNNKHLSFLSYRSHNVFSMIYKS